jgi:DNA-binding CsgD family transcriptional regulator
LHILARGWVRLARERAALTILPIALGFLAGAELYAGHPDECEALAKQILDISAATGNPGYLGALIRSDVSLLAWRGNEAGARASGVAEMADALEHGQAGMANWVRFALVHLDLGLCHYLAALENALPIYKDDIPSFIGSWVLPNLIEAAVRSGNEETARDALGRLSERAGASGTPLALGFLARSQALLADDLEAESLYKESIDQLGRSPARPELGRAHLLYGEWLRRQGRKREARDQLRIAHDMFSSTGVGAFAERARAELAATGARARKRSVETQSQLTPQEAQIARLAGQGVRNQEIAAQLFISTSTVEYHLVKVFRKLGVTSRTQLAHFI